MLHPHFKPAGLCGSGRAQSNKINIRPTTNAMIETPVGSDSEVEQDDRNDRNNSEKRESEGIRQSVDKGKSKLYAEDGVNADQASARGSRLQDSLFRGDQIDAPVVNAKVYSMEVSKVSEEIKTDEVATLVNLVDPRTTLNDLPHELLFEIFSWLPLATRLCIRCTCKLWKKLTTDPRILAIQLSRQCPTNVGHLVSLSGVEHRVCYVEKVGPNLRCLGPIVHHRARVVSPYPRSSGGLVLYETSSGLPRFYYVENPITGERIQIQDDKLGHTSHGFGYSSSTKEYKIVKLEGMPPLSVAVFTIGSGHWRRLGDAPFYPDSNLPFECGGLIFWKIIQDQKAIDMNRLVMSFDVASECFRTWRGPALGKNINRNDVNIAKIGTCAACVYGKWSNTLQIWVMRDMGKDVWVKEHNIFYTCFPRVVFDQRLSSGSWIGNDVFFGKDSTGLFGCYRYYYSANDGGSGGFKFMTSPIQGAFLGAMDHIGSLVSPLKLINQGNN